MSPDQIENLSKRIDELTAAIEVRVAQEAKITEARDRVLLIQVKSETARIESAFNQHCEAQKRSEGHVSAGLTRLHTRVDQIYELLGGKAICAETGVKQNVEITGTVDGPASGNFSIGFGFFKLAAAGLGGAGILGLGQYVVRFIGGLG